MFVGEWKVSGITSRLECSEMMLPETWSPNQLSFPGKLLPHSTLPLVVV